MIGWYVIRDADGGASVDVNGDAIAAALVEADEQSWPLLTWDERIRYETLARAALKAMGGEQR